MYGGDGLARADGRVVLTPFVLPGETVHVQVSPAKGGILRGRLDDVVTPSAERADPLCPYFFRCGGCQYQHASYTYQLRQKEAILREVLQRVGRVRWENSIEVIAAEPWGYRNRAQLHVRQGKAGYFEAGSHRLVPITSCPISSPRLNTRIAQLAHELPRYRDFETTLELFTNEIDVQVHTSGPVPASARNLIHSLGVTTPIEYGGLRVSRNSFFQVNRFLIENLVETALGGAQGGSALDLYAGVGLFSLPLARTFTKVTAVELGNSAARDLEYNSRRANADIQIVRTSAEDFLHALQHAPDLLVADPPRAGLGQAVLRELSRLRPGALTIVACDPATLARDLGPLLGTGYRIEKLTVVDLFPQTAHFETIVHLAC